MILVVVAIHVISYIIYWAIEGIREGYYYDRLPRESVYSGDRLILNKQKTIKPEFVIQRASFLMISFISGFYLLHDYIYLVGLLCIQPFIHLGFYYKTRNKLNPSIYLGKFLCNASPTSTSLLDLESKKFFRKYFSINGYFHLTQTPIIRIVLFSFGVFLILISLL